MRTTKLLAAAAVLSAMVATPVLAQELTPLSSMGAYNSDGSYGTRTKMKKQVRYNGNERGMRTSHDNWNRRDTGFWPGAVAAGIVGGAVGTAGVIASAPFRNTYASGDRYQYGGHDNSYTARNDYMSRTGFVCQPGTMIRAQNGERQICQ